MNPETAVKAPALTRPVSELAGDPQWYKDAVIYQLHVRAFRDGNADGVGDFPGLTSRLDYLRDLGVTALWLLPFYPSPLRDDGYDIADYRGVHPSYGTLDDFRAFLDGAHERGLRVITELVINHTSDRHPWFQRARRAPPGSVERDFYVWSDTPERYSESRIIFKDFETSNWTRDPLADAYYWHRFYAHQPDLNFDNPAVREAVIEIMEYWLRLGVDGLRLDAVPYLYEREGTSCENLPETHAFLRTLRARLDAGFENRMLLAEANQWPEDAADYFGEGDECHMAFHFPIMPRLFMAIRSEDRFPILDILEQTPEIPDSAQWAIFLRNHDELTLEMVTDEERDYMYRVYADDARSRINLGIRRRLAPLLGNNRRKIELMMGLLFSLPGTPVLYYGDEIGMGDNIYLGDRHGVRTPMQWNGDRNAGFSEANPQQVYLPLITDPEYRYEAVNVESQRVNPSSLLWWVRRLIGLRAHVRAFGRGAVEPVRVDNPKVLAFVRRHEGEAVLAVFNLSRFVQAANLELEELAGSMPRELFGGARFPVIGERPYMLTLGPHSFYWFDLRAEPETWDGGTRAGTGGVRTIAVAGAWTRLFEVDRRSPLDSVLPPYLASRRWFGAKAQGLRGATLRESLPLRFGDRFARVALIEAAPFQGDPQTYLLPVAHAEGEDAERFLEGLPQAVICRVIERGEVDGAREGVLYDALYDPAFCTALLELIAAGGAAGEGDVQLVARSTTALSSLLGEAGTLPVPTPLSVEQSNSSVRYGDRLILKLFRRIEPGINPEVELGELLGERGFEHTPPLAGVLELHGVRAAPMSVGILQGYVPNEGDAWSYTLDVLGRYFERVVAEGREPPEPETSAAALLRAAGREPLEMEAELLGAYMESARVLGRRTAEMHRALASGPRGSEFGPEPFTELYQRSLYQSMRNSAGQLFRMLESRLPERDGPLGEQGGRILSLRGEVLRRLRGVREGRLSAVRTRTHGDYHLGQVLYTGKDFVIIDFEGEPARPLGERRLKRSPLRDVAGMLRSFHYAAHAALAAALSDRLAREDERDTWEPWARYWYAHAAARFLEGYADAAEGAALIPASSQQAGVLLEAYLLEKALYELAYELNNRPSWAGIPARGLLDLLEKP